MNIFKRKIIRDFKKEQKRLRANKKTKKTAKKLKEAFPIGSHFKHLGLKMCVTSEASYFIGHELAILCVPEFEYVDKEGRIHKKDFSTRFLLAKRKEMKK